MKKKGFIGRVRAAVMRCFALFLTVPMLLPVLSGCGGAQNGKFSASNGANNAQNGEFGASSGANDAQDVLDGAAYDGALPALSTLAKLGVYDETIGDATPEESAAIWAHARALVAAWYEAYEALRATPDIKPEIIKRNADDFSIGIYSDTQKGNFKETASKLRKTRTTETLSGWLNSRYYDKEYETDIYGGWVNKYLQQQATGHFYVKKVEGRWYFIDPLGYPLIVRTIVAPQRSYASNPRQMEAAETLYGTPDKWAIAVTHDLHEMGFTTTTPGENAADLDAIPVHRLSYQVSVDVITAYGKEIGVCSKQGSTYFDQDLANANVTDNTDYDNVMPVFDPAFEEAADRLLREKFETLDRDDPYLLGVTTDNEIPMNRDMLDRYLFKITPDVAQSRYSWATAWTWFRFMTGKANPTEKDVTPALRELFRGFVYWRYFDVVEPAFRRHAGDTMYFGVRLLTGPSSTSVAEAEWVIRFAAQYVDVININWYRVWTLAPETAANLTKWSGDKPFQISEFGVKSDDGQIIYANAAGGWYVKRQSERGQFYENFILSFLEWKNNVGWQFYRYNHYWTNKGTVPRSGCGIVDDDHRYYAELVEAFDNINNHVYGLIEFFDNP